MITLLIATRNRHKVQEIQAILGSEFRYLTLNDFLQAPAIKEDADTFAGNATKKAVGLAEWLAATPAGATPLISGGEVFVLADDSGLEVDALQGAPGVYSARFAALDTAGEGNSPDADNNAKLLRLLKDVPLTRRTARFRCVIALTPMISAGAENASPVCHAREAELSTQIFDGTCEGHLDVSLRGQGGFGYDPLFIPKGFTQSFAELGEDIKNRLSHRSHALMNLLAARPFKSVS